jgi:hypothetical protein
MRRRRGSSYRLLDGEVGTTYLRGRGIGAGGGQSGSLHGMALANHRPTLLPSTSPMGRSQTIRAQEDNRGLRSSTAGGGDPHDLPRPPKMAMLGGLFLDGKRSVLDHQPRGRDLRGCMTQKEVPR